MKVYGVAGRASIINSMIARPVNIFVCVLLYLYVLKRNVKCKETYLNNSVYIILGLLVSRVIDISIYFIASDSNLYASI
jgi:hypothetical protein